MRVSAVTLRPLDDATIEALLAVAITDAEPEEVIPPVDGPAGWIPERIESFRVFHRERLAGLTGPLRTIMFAIQTDLDVVGMIRMSWLDEPGQMETGMWLGRSARGLGLGAAALAALLEKAAHAGASVVMAQTTAGNTGALGALRRCGAELSHTPGSPEVTARIAVVTPASVAPTPATTALAAPALTASAPAVSALPEAVSQPS